MGHRADTATETATATAAAAAAAMSGSAMSGGARRADNPCRYCPLCRRNDVNEIHALRVRDAEQGSAHKVTPLHTVVWLIKMLGGHVHGECVALMIARDNTTSSMSTSCKAGGGTLVECSMIPALIPAFMEFLKDYDFKVTRHNEINHSDVINDCLITTAPMPVTPLSIGTRILQVTPARIPANTMPDIPGGSATPSIHTRLRMPGMPGMPGMHSTPHPTHPTLTILIVPYVTNTYPMQAVTSSAHCVFDMQLMSSSRTSLYVRNRPGRVGDLCEQLRRAQLRQFALLPRGCDPTASDQAVFMCYAMRMVLERGWHMDDSIVGRDGWVVARWGVMDTAPLCVRNSGCDESLLTMHKECPICFSEFAAGDIVVNLPCNHNIHATCDMVNNNSGMCMWLVTGKNPTCPCCRANIVR